VRNGEAFAASGYRNFSTFFGAANSVNLTEQGTWAPTLKANPSLWCYGGGAGSFTSIAGLGMRTVTMTWSPPNCTPRTSRALSGCFSAAGWGDWDSEDNILRTFLAMPSYGLASMCSGRPHWFVHHMALG
jgi:hypothetical protein